MGEREHGVPIKAAGATFRGQLLQNSILDLTHLETMQLGIPAFKGGDLNYFALLVVKQLPLKVEIREVKWGTRCINFYTTIYLLFMFHIL